MMIHVMSHKSRGEVRHIRVVLESVLSRYELTGNTTASGNSGLVQGNEAAAIAPQRVALVDGMSFDNWLATAAEI